MQSSLKVGFHVISCVAVENTSGGMRDAWAGAVHRLLLLGRFAQLREVNGMHSQQLLVVQVKDQ